MSSRNSPSEPFYISLDVVLEIHQRQLKEFGGFGTFLAINGFEIEDEQMELYDAMIAIAEKRMSKEQLASLFERLVAK